MNIPSLSMSLGLPQYQEPLSVGLLKRGEKNDIEAYAKMAKIVSSTAEVGNEFWNYLGEQIKQNPEEYFNFGFTYNDFKQFLLKLMYMRAERKFFEKSFSEKIDSRNPYEYEAQEH